MNATACLGGRSWHPRWPEWSFVGWWPLVKMQMVQGLLGGLRVWQQHKPVPVSLFKPEASAQVSQRLQGGLAESRGGVGGGLVHTCAESELTHWVSHLSPVCGALRRLLGAVFSPQTRL